MEDCTNFIHKVPKALSKCFKWINGINSRNIHRIFFLYISILISLFKYENIVRSSAWSFGHSDPDPGSAFQKYLANSIYGQFYFITAFFCYFGSKNCNNEINRPKNS